jgi:prepilin-type N-terminal cleavage/methylation domain-containing protein
MRRPRNQKKNYLTIAEELGFTLVEVIVAVAIISFAIFATLRVITASLNSITRQGQRIKALHLAQAHLAKLEAESFSKVVPETWRIGTGELYWYQLSIYDLNHPFLTVNQFINSDCTYWYLPLPDGLGFSNDGRNDGILVASADGSVYTCASATTNETGGPGTLGVQDYNWDTDDFKLFFDDEEEKIQIYYCYHHLIHEGATVPFFDGERLKEKAIKLYTSVGDTNGNGTGGEKDDILGEDLTAGNSLSSSDYDSFSPENKELTFVDSKKGNSVRIYYLPLRDGQDPASDSIVGIVKGNLWDPDSGGTTTEISPNTIKKITVNEYWKQGKDIQWTTQETYITR